MLTYRVYPTPPCVSSVLILPPGDVNHIILNEGTGVLTLGSEAVDYETGDRSFSLTVRAIDNPDGPASDRLTVST